MGSNDIDTNKREANLIRRAQQGDADAFGVLYKEHVTAVYRYVYFRVRNVADAEDYTEQAFLNAWQALPKYQVREDKPILAWLYRIAANVIVDEKRRQKAQLVDMESQFDLPSELESPEDETEFALQLDSVRGLLEQLNPDYKDVLILRFLNGLDHKATAEAMGKSPGAIRVLQHRAVNALRERMGL